MKTQQGLFFATTLMLIFVMVLLVLSLLKAVFFYLKITHEVTHRHEIFHQLEAGLQRLVLDDSKCQVTHMSPNQILEMLEHQQGCTFTMNQQNYDYLTDDLGLSPCLYIGTRDAPLSSHHWLLTIATRPPHQEVIQVRVAKRAKQLTCSSPDARPIQEGVISWRYLPPLYPKKDLSIIPIASQ
ncbi:MAG: hypothetical protein NTW94_05670 [Legionellales bacterium]|nr:hypothetical protein [Legionellales bacterium]